MGLHTTTQMVSDENHNKIQQQLKKITNYKYKENNKRKKYFNLKWIIFKLIIIIT